MKFASRNSSYVYWSKYFENVFHVYFDKTSSLFIVHKPRKHICIRFCPTFLNIQNLCNFLTNLADLALADKAFKSSKKLIF